MSNWKIGDEALYEFRVVNINKVEDDGSISSVSEGMFLRGGYNLQVFPVTDLGTRVSDVFLKIMEMLRRDCPHLNWPAVSEHLVKLWNDAMEAGTEEAGTEAMGAAATFAGRVLHAYQTTEVDGVKLFRP